VRPGQYAENQLQIFYGAASGLSRGGDPGSGFRICSRAGFDSLKGDWFNRRSLKCFPGGGVIGFIRKRLHWHRLHSVLGLWCSLFLLFVFLTGVLAVFATEIDRLFTPEMQVAGAGGKKSLGAVYNAVKAARPDADVMVITRPVSATMADQVFLREPGRTWDTIYWADPYRPELRGKGVRFTFKSAIRTLHRELFLPSKYGVPLVTIFTFALSGLLVAGIMQLLRFWKSFIIRPRFGGGRTRAWASDLHRLTGVWSVVFLIPICLTGIWYFAESAGLGAKGLPGHEAKPERAILLADTFDGVALDRAVATAQEVLPGLRVRNVMFPRWPQMPIIIQGQLSALLVRDRANAVYLDPDTLAVRGVHRGEDLSVHQRISEMADPLHFGTWGGLWSKIAWTVFGLMLTALAGLGALIHAKRLAARKVPGSGLRLYWAGMGLGKWVSLALIGGSLALMIRALLQS
jgi:uncharacterized iron-regulated membrane protein